MPKARKPYLEFGRKLTLLRRARKLTQEQAAELVDISVQYYQALEQGEKIAAYSTLARIKKKLKISSWDDLLPVN